MVRVEMRMVRADGWILSASIGLYDFAFLELTSRWSQQNIRVQKCLRRLQRWRLRECLPGRGGMKHLINSERPSGRRPFKNK